MFLPVSHSAVKWADMAERPVLTIPEAADALRVSRATVYRIIDDGDLQSIMVRGVMRVRLSALNRYLDALERRARDEMVGFDV